VGGQCACLLPYCGAMVRHTGVLSSSTNKMQPSRGAMLLAVLAAIGTASFGFAHESFVGTPLSADRSKSPLALKDQLGGPKYKGRINRFPRYQGFVYRRKQMEGLRIRLYDYGRKHYAFYRIVACAQDKKTARTSRYLELLGWWDPNKDLDSKDAFVLRADRSLYWLRRGANPTDSVANLFDIIGLIRRTGPWSKRGEWEFRVDKYSGPEEPEGWKWNGAQKVTWGNAARVRSLKSPGTKRRNRDLDGVPQIERFGFQGYERIPLDDDAANEPLEASATQEAFPNTYIPG